MLGVVLQERTTALGGQAVLAYSALAAAGAAIGGTVQIVAGVFSDRALAAAGDRRAFYGLGVVLAIPAIVVLPAVPTLGALWCAMVLLQIGMNVAGGPFQAIVSDYLPPDRVGRAAAWMSIYQFSGNVVGIVLTTQLRGLALGVALALCLAGGWFATESYLRTRPRIASSTLSGAGLKLNPFARKGSSRSAAGGRFSIRSANSSMKAPACAARAGVSRPRVKNSSNWSNARNGVTRSFRALQKWFPSR